MRSYNMDSLTKSKADGGAGIFMKPGHARRLLRYLQSSGCGDSQVATHPSIGTHPSICTYAVNGQKKKDPQHDQQQDQIEPDGHNELQSREATQHGHEKNQEYLLDVDQPPRFQDTATGDVVREPDVLQQLSQTAGSTSFAGRHVKENVHDPPENDQQNQRELEQFEKQQTGKNGWSSYHNDSLFQQHPPKFFESQPPEQFYQPGTSGANSASRASKKACVSKRNVAVLQAITNTLPASARISDKHSKKLRLDPISL
jgi:hypothetical protein